MRILILCLCLLAFPAAAEKPMTPDQLLDRLVGGSAIFTDRTSGARVGVEYFPSRESSFWTQQNGRCTTGKLTVEGDALCFRYEDSPLIAHCWLPFLDDDQLGYRSIATGEVQLIEPVPGLSLSCTDGLVS